VDDTVRSLSVLEAKLAPVSEIAKTETAINSSAKAECGFTLTPPGVNRLSGLSVMGSVLHFLNIDPAIPLVPLRRVRGRSGGLTGVRSC